METVITKLVNVFVKKIVMELELAIRNMDIVSVIWVTMAMPVNVSLYSLNLGKCRAFQVSFSDKKCPQYLNKICNNQGKCDTSTGICFCNNGFSGKDCSNCN